jgi:MFS family permease
MIAKVTPKAIIMFILVTSFYCYEFFLQVAPAAMTHELIDAFNANAAQLGLLASAFFYAYTLFQIPAGLILDKVGCRVLLTIATIICAAGTLYFAVATTLYSAALARFITGLGSTVAFICTLYIVLRWFPARRFALMAGIAQFMSGIGAIGGEAPLALLKNALGWRNTSWLLALIGFGLAIIIFAFLRDHPKHTREIARATPRVPIFEGLTHIIRQPQMWWIALYAFASWAPATAFASLWGVPFLKTSLHLSTVWATGAMSWIWVGIAVSSPTIGWLSDHLHNRCWPLTIAPLIGLIALIIIIYLSPSSTMLLWLLLFVAGIGGAGQTLIFALVKDINPLKYTSIANGFTNMAVVASGAVLQPLIGTFIDWHWKGLSFQGIPIYSTADYRIALIVIPACYLLAAIIARFFLQETHCQHQFVEETHNNIEIESKG